MNQFLGVVRPFMPEADFPNSCGCWLKLKPSIRMAKMFPKRRSARI